MSANSDKGSPSCRDKPGHDGVGKRRVARLAVVAFAIILFVTATIGAWTISLGPLPLTQARQVSTSIVDRNGKLLRAYAMADGRWRLPVDASTAVDPTYLKLLLGYEDRRFRSHAGVDPLALGRAAMQLVTRGHIVSGGSTITMQLARLMEPRRERSVYAKLRQMVRALEIERQLTKDQILNLYLALAPYGGNLEGIRAASIAYFGKEPKRLSLAEAALGPLSGSRAHRAKSRARPHGRRAPRIGSGCRSGQGGASAAAAQADTHSGAAFRRSRHRHRERRPRHFADAGFQFAKSPGSVGP
jgi:penicillin-binding protein 1C